MSTSVLQTLKLVLVQEPDHRDVQKPLMTHVKPAGKNVTVSTLKFSQVSRVFPFFSTAAPSTHAPRQAFRLPFRLPSKKNKTELGTLSRLWALKTWDFTTQKALTKSTGDKRVICHSYFMLLVFDIYILEYPWSIWMLNPSIPFISFQCWFEVANSMRGKFPAARIILLSPISTGTSWQSWEDSFFMFFCSMRATINGISWNITPYNANLCKHPWLSRMVFFCWSCCYNWQLLCKQLIKLELEIAKRN